MAMSSDISRIMRHCLTDPVKGKERKMKKNVFLNVGDIVTPIKEFSIGYGYNKFYQVEEVIGDVFVGRFLAKDFSPLGNGTERLPIYRFRFYRKGVCNG